MQAAHAFFSLVVRSAIQLRGVVCEVATWAGCTAHRLSHTASRLPKGNEMLAARQNESVSFHGRMRFGAIDLHPLWRAFCDSQGAGAAAISELDRIGGSGRGSQIAVEVEQPVGGRVGPGLQRVSSGGNPDRLAVCNRPKITIHQRRTAPPDARAARGMDDKLVLRIRRDRRWMPRRPEAANRSGRWSFRNRALHAETPRKHGGPIRTIPFRSVVSWDIRPGGARRR